MFIEETSVGIKERSTNARESFFDVIIPKTWQRTTISRDRCLFPVQHKILQSLEDQSSALVVYLSASSLR